MNFGVHELLATSKCIAVLPVFFLFPEYVTAWVTNVMRFRQKNWIEQLLWSCALSVPVALLAAAHPGVGFSTALTTAAFLVCCLAAAVLAYVDRRQEVLRSAWDRDATIISIIALGLVPYVVLSVLPIEVRGRLYESSVWQDWNVRIQLVNAAIRGGNHPLNPMFAVAGHPPALRYYYFWYVLCARMHDVTGSDARSVLMASCVGSGLALLSFLLLSIKYLSASHIPVRRQCTAAMVVAAILGLDAIAALIGLLHGRFYADLQFWLNDRSPSWLHMILWAPHHVGGLVCAGMGLLLLVHAFDLTGRPQWMHGAVAGICFAAAIGTSSFIALLFGLACLAVAFDALLRRQWKLIAAMAIAAVLALMLIAPFLHSIRLTSAAPAGQADQHPVVLTVVPRYKFQALRYMWLTIQAVTHDPRFGPSEDDPDFNRLKWEMRLFRPPYLAGMLVFEFGFFLFIVVAAFRRDFRRNSTMSQAARQLWLIFAGFALPGFFLSSGSLQGNNDFGRHAGFCMRYVLLLWAAPMVAAFFERRRVAHAINQRPKLSTAMRWAVGFAAIGIFGQILQILVVRFRFPLAAAGMLPQTVVAERVPRIAVRFAQIRTAMEVADRLTPASGVVQDNPHSRFAGVFLLYTNRQMAAADDGCNTPFGGDARECAPMARALIELFGGMGPLYHGQSLLFDQRIGENPELIVQEIGFDPTLVTPQHFASVCATYGISTMIASYVDPAWGDRDSWVWKLQPEYANATARVLRCPVPEEK